MKVMFYAPHAAIWSHAFPEALVAEALSQQDSEIYYVGCGKQFKSYCVAMSAYGLRFDSPRSKKEGVCKRCERNKEFIRKEFGLVGSDIAEELSPEDVQHAEEMLGGVTAENYLDLKYSGIEVGRLALYEFLLNHKKNNLVIDPDKWTEFREAVRNSLYSAMASLKILERERPDRLITYNSFYSVNHVCCIAADELSIPHYLMHSGNNMAHRMETLIVAKGYSYNYIARNPLWKHYMDIPCASAQLSMVTDHVLALFEGKSMFVYSSPKSRKALDLRKRFGISRHQKILVATMSCHDERFAAVTIGVMPPDNDLVFPSQIDWIDALKKFVAGRPDLFLIIRVHPREFPNKRESVTSEYASKLRARLVDLPGNARVNWPSDQISLYDIASIADLFLNSRSTTGLEMSLLGLPVLVYSPDQLFSYPSDLNYVADSKGEYFQQIDHALAHGWDIEFSRKAYRWGVFQYCRATIDISDSYSGDESFGKGLVARAINKIIRKLVPFYQQRKDSSRRTKNLRSKETLSKLLASGKDCTVEIDARNPETPTLEQETESLKRELGRICAAMCEGRKGETEQLQRKIQNFIG